MGTQQKAQGSFRMLQLAIKRNVVPKKTQKPTADGKRPRLLGYQKRPKDWWPICRVSCSILNEPTVGWFEAANTALNMYPPSPVQAQPHRNIFAL